jgi:sugar lactone lactonase YvrE
MLLGSAANPTSMLLARSSLLRTFLAFLLLTRPVLATTGSEWERVLCEFGNLETLGGGFGEGADNPNEWLTAYEGANAMAVEFSEPHMAMDDIWGNVYVADKNAHAIRKIRPDGTVATVAGRHRFMAPNAGGFDGDGIATQQLLSYPNGLHVFPDGSFYFLETGEATTLARIRKVTRSGQMTTILTDTGLTMQRGLWVSPDETFLYFCSTTKLKRFNIGMPLSATNPRNLVDLTGAGSPDLGNIDVDASGNVLLTSRGLHVVYLVPPNANNLTTPQVVAGNGTTGGTTFGNNLADDNQIATAVALNGVRGAAFHPLGGYFLGCHRGGDVWYVDTQTPPRIHLVIQGNNSGTLRTGDGQPVTVNRGTSKLAEVRSVRFGWNGDLILCTNDSGFIRRVRSLTVPLAVQPTTTAPGKLDWTAPTNRRYFLERSETLIPNSWATRAWIAPLTPGPQSVQDTVLSSRGFYRLHGYRWWPN